MSINVEFQSQDNYDIEYMYKSLFPKEFQDSKDQKMYDRTLSSLLKHDSRSATLKNPFLDTIVECATVEPEKSIEFIARPYTLEGKKVTIDNNHEYHSPLEGGFLIELIPKNFGIKPYSLNRIAPICINNHNHCVLRYEISSGYKSSMLGLDHPEPIEVTIYLSYESMESKNKKVDTKVA